MATVSIKPEIMAPVEHLPSYTFSERQMRLLADSLYASWARPEGDKSYVAFVNVGLFYSVYRPPFVPDFLLSLDVEPPSGNLMEKHNRSYFIWEYGKSPDVVIEIVSNREGGEDTTKLAGYARIGVTYYIIFDPDEQLRAGILRVYGLSQSKRYEPLGKLWLPVVGLGLTIWEGDYQGMQNIWLRWCDENGALLLTGAERAEQERQRADQEQQRAEKAEGRIERLLAQLRAAGMEPDNGKH